MRLAEREIIKDWTRVDDFEVADAEIRSFEYHVVKDVKARRVTLTIKCFDQGANIVRLDPTIIPEMSDPESFPDIAEKRVRELYCRGRI